MQFVYLCAIPKSGLMDDISVEIFDEQVLLDRIKDKREFRPSENSVLFIKHGTLSLLVEGELNHYSENSILFISPRNLYTLNSITDDLSLFIIRRNALFNRDLNFNFNRFEVYSIIAIENKNAILVPEKEFEHIWAILNTIYYKSHNSENQHYKNEVLSHLLIALVYAMVSQIELSAKQDFNDTTSRKEYITITFLQLTFAHYLEEKELAFYADRLNVSIKYLSICVKDTTGHPPTYFLTEFLLDYARNMLVNQNFSVYDVADKLGFADQYSFSKFFKKNTGISPSQFRKQILTSHTI